MSLPYSARCQVIQTKTWTKLGERDYIRKYDALLTSALWDLYNSPLKSRA